MLMEIPDDIAGRLKALAERNDRRVEDVLYDMLMLHDAAIKVAEGRKYATAADLGRVAKQAAVELEALRREESDASCKSTTADNSGQVLQEIYAEKLHQRADS